MPCQRFTPPLTRSRCLKNLRTNSDSSTEWNVYRLCIITNARPITTSTSYSVKGNCFPNLTSRLPPEAYFMTKQEKGYEPRKKSQTRTVKSEKAVPLSKRGKFNQDLAEWEQAVKNGQKPAEKQNRPPERQSVRNRLRQLQEEGKQNSQPKQRKKSQDRDR